MIVPKRKQGYVIEDDDDVESIIHLITKNIYYIFYFSIYFNIYCEQINSSWWNIYINHHFYFHCHQDYQHTESVAVA